MLSARTTRSRVAFALALTLLIIVSCQSLVSPRLSGATSAHARLDAAIVLTADPAEDARADDFDSDPIATALVTVTPLPTHSLSPLRTHTTSVAWNQRQLLRSTCLRC